jgi:hypothetical protein
MILLTELGWCLISHGRGGIYSDLRWLQKLMLSIGLDRFLYISFSLNNNKHGNRAVLMPSLMTAMLHWGWLSPTIMVCEQADDPLSAGSANDDNSIDSKDAKWVLLPQFQ